MDGIKNFNGDYVVAQKDYYRYLNWYFSRLISDKFIEWKTECDNRFNKLKANEEELNRIFIDIYGLQDELTPEVDDKDVTVRKADLQRDIKSLISYAVGCMFGRYSLDVEGLAYAGGDWDASKYFTFIPDTDNIIPITDEEYFEDDILGLFCGWLKKVYGADTLEQNLDFIAAALGNKGSTSREIIRSYFVNDFFKDHCQTYSVTGSGKRPIYWLFDSGKQNGFKALIYLHRYNADTIGNLRVDYLHRMQRVYESEISYDKAYVEKHKDFIELHKSLTEESSEYNSTSKNSKSPDSSTSKKNSSSKGNSSSKSSSKSSGKKSGKSSGSYKYDPYDVYKYSDPEDFADEWEDDFDDWEDAYEYWEDSR